jgi:hypothetical protein
MGRRATVRSSDSRSARRARIARLPTPDPDGFRSVDVQHFVSCPGENGRFLSNAFLSHSVELRPTDTEVPFDIRRIRQESFSFGLTFRDDGVCDTRTVPVVPGRPRGPKGFASLRRHPRDVNDRPEASDI